MPLVWELGEFVLILGVLCFIIMQVVIPTIRGTPLYPMFRKEGKLRKEIKEVRQEVVEASLQDEVKKTKKQL